MTAEVAVDRLCCRRPGFQLGPLTFAVPAGGRLAVVGPSGSGKTTLLRCLAGLDRPAGGAIRIGGRIVAGGAAFVPPERRQLGLVFQDGALWTHMTVLQHLSFAAPGMSAEAARALLDRVGLLAHAGKKPGALSGGEAQRLGLARALAPAPAVLLLDEPLRSVDVHQRDGLALLVRALADERRLTTILVTHDRDEALALATDLVVLHDGVLVEQGNASELLARPRSAFTAAFLRGAACLPTAADGAGRIATPLGAFDRPPDAGGDLRLVLFPGEAEALAPGSGGAPGRVLAMLPGDGQQRVAVALGAQIIAARTTAALQPGQQAELRLTAEPRLLPWQPLSPNLEPT